MADRFYLNCSLNLGPIELDRAESHHLTTVRRFRPGDRVTLFNGDGQEYQAVVEQIEKRRVSLLIESVSRVNRELPFTLEVACPLPKGDRAQFLIEKLTELGVSRFVPLETTRSVVSPKEAKMEKLERWVIEASKQCGRNELMGIADLTHWQEYVSKATTGISLIAHFGGQSVSKVDNEQSVQLAIGPEGGFTDEELATAAEHHWLKVDLGQRTLRMETAAIALTSLMVLN